MTIESATTFEIHRFLCKMKVDGEPRAYIIEKREWVYGPLNKEDREFNLEVHRNMVANIGGVPITQKDTFFIPMEAGSLSEAFMMAPQAESDWIEKQKSQMRSKMLTAGVNGFDPKRMQ